MPQVHPKPLVLGNTKHRTTTESGRRPAWGYADPAIPYPYDVAGTLRVDDRLKVQDHPIC